MAADVKMDATIPLGPVLEFVPLPLSYFVFLFGATATYLLIVEIVKRRLMKTR